MDNYDTPKIIQDLFSLEYHTENDFIDFEAFGNFLSQEETAQWLYYWTGNPEFEGEEFRVFGTEGTGGYYAFWLKKENTDILEQPVVFFGSEGELYAVSSNFSDFLWCLYTGLNFSGRKKEISESVLKFVKNNTTTPKRTLDEILEEANDLFHDFKDYIMSKVTYK